MALHPAAIRHVLKPFRVALTGGRSKMFIADAAERSIPGSTLVSGEKRIKASKNPTFRTERPKPQIPNPREYFVELLQYRDTISIRIVRSDFRCLGQARRIFWRA